MPRMMLLCLLLLALWNITPSAQAVASAPVKNEHSTARLLAENTAFKPGQHLWLLLELDLQKGWHSYWQNPGDSGLSTTIRWTLPEGVTAEPILWGAPEKLETAGLVSYGFEDMAYHLVRLNIPETTSSPLEIKAKASWLVCKEVCVPEAAEFTLELPIGEASPDPESAEAFAQARRALPKAMESALRYTYHEGKFLLSFPGRDANPEFFPAKAGWINHGATPEFGQQNGVGYLAIESGPQPATEVLEGVIRWGGSAFHISANPDNNLATEALAAIAQNAASPTTTPPLPEIAWWQAILFALLGGLVLNAMPCVFPILSLKAVAIARKAEACNSKTRREGIAYTAGVLLCFSAMAAILLALREAGIAAGWGYHMQSPIFVTLMAYILFAMGLSLSGVFYVPGFGALSGVGSGKDGASGSFFTGFLATLVATPCTAPFMAPALGFALAQPIFLALSVFWALGLGLALPYLLISFIPAFRRWLPKPGAWMEHFKQLLAFPMYASAAWLLWVLSIESGPTGLAIALTGLLLIAFITWLMPFSRRWGRGGKWTLLLATALFLAAGLSMLQTTPHGTGQGESHLGAIPFDAAALETLRKEGKPVLVNATAAWCITCKVNERVAFSTDRVQTLIKERGITYMVADWTNQDPVITDWLESFGRSGVPLYVYYPPHAEPVVLPQLLTPGSVSSLLVN